MKRLLLLLPVAALMCLTSCFKEEDDYAAKDKKTIEKYIANHGLTAQSTASGVYYVIEKPGDATHPTLSSTVTVKYTGYLTDGTEFDSSDGKAVSFALSGVISGWQIGIPLFGKGGKGTLLIPSDLGYGSYYIGNIPPHSVLIFDVELVSFTN
ncbi:MAG TPA: FKBP-type peptidyl-prolyl cis-trans isomerase [Bacteroidales bacterium]|nr:FKBP-type peptidyl-prolyl cis-trans isomerase [Bacteroidales bacterium]HPT02680.1 FKBP-type peptidyl-prolyl cis-trans isomerase [Bacteroidales bacterium]